MLEKRKRYDKESKAARSCLSPAQKALTFMITRVGPSSITATTRCALI